MVKLENIKKNYVSRKITTIALNDISLTLPNKGLVFIVGKSGCGKTTLLNVLGGLDKFDSGKMICHGKDTADFLNNDWDRYRNSYIGFVFQENNLLEQYNVFENIKLATDLQNIKNYEEKINSALNFVGLEKLASRKINELSGGQKQRVAIARAIAKNSKILLADEPTGSLDSETSQEIFNLLKTLSKEQLVVVVTHDLTSAKEYGDRIIEMKDGQIVNDTEKEKEEIEQTEKLILEKSYFNPKMCVKLSINIFKKVPLRLLVLTFLSMFGFSLMVGAIKIATWEPYDLQHKVLALEENAYISLSPIEVKIDENRFHLTEREFTSQGFNEFEQKYKEVKMIGVSKYDESMGSGTYDTLTEREKVYYYDRFNGVAFLTERDFTDFGLELIAGDFPKEDWEENDVIVSKYMYEIYTMTGICSQTKRVEINSYEDLIGEKFGGPYGDQYTIKGIVDTKFDKPKYAQIKNYSLGISDDLSLNLEDEYDDFIRVGFQTILFRNPLYKDSTEKYSYIIAKYEKDAFEESNLLNDVLETGEYQFYGNYSREIRIEAEQSEGYGQKLLVLAGVIILFAVVLFANFITISIKDKTKQIGILRAIGTTKRQISIIFIVQNGIIALGVFVFSCIMVKCSIMPMLMYMNAMSSDDLPFPRYESRFLDYAILFGTIMLTSILASLIPLFRLSRKTPRELMTK